MTIYEGGRGARKDGRSRRLRVAYREGQWMINTVDARGREVEIGTGICDPQHIGTAHQRALDLAASVGQSADKTEGGSCMTLSAMRDALVRDYRCQQRSPRTILRAQQVFDMLLRFTEDLPIPQITGETLHRYVAHRMETVSRGTARTEVAILKHAFRLYASYGRIDKLPAFPILRPPAPRKGFLEEEQLEKIVAYVSAEVKPLIRFLNWTGWRVSEAKNLQWSCVDFVAQIVRLEPGESKNEEGREFPFRYAPALRVILDEQRDLVSYLERVQKFAIPWVFPRHSGAPIVDISETWENARRKAGFPSALVHDLRRTAVRRLELAGVPRSIAMRLTGHKTERIYSAYAITSPADLGEGVRRLNEYVERTKRQRDLEGKGGGKGDGIKGDDVRR